MITDTTSIAKTGDIIDVTMGDGFQFRIDMTNPTSPPMYTDFTGKGLPLTAHQRATADEVCKVMCRNQV